MAVCNESSPSSYYTLTTSISPTGGGTVSVSPSKAKYESGESVAVTATAASGYAFIGWSGATSIETSTAIIVMNGNKTLAANFAPTQYTLTATVSPTGGGTVSPSPNKAKYNAGESVEVTAAAASGYVFAGWTGAMTGSANPATVKMDGNKALTAAFTRQGSGGAETNYTLTTSVFPTTPMVGGTVSRSPSLASYEPGTSVMVTALASNNYTFIGWTGSITGMDNPVTVVMDGNIVLAANFAQQSSGGDNGIYKSVTIDSVRWMAENLNVETANSWCYGNVGSNCAKYGRLYTWVAAKTACQSIGWRLPSRTEWDSLVISAGGKEVAGKKLKAKSGWNSNGNGSDDFGFSALPGGYRNYGGEFFVAGVGGRWWTATESGAAYADGLYMENGSDSVHENVNDKNSGLSVRCVGE